MLLHDHRVEENAVKNFLTEVRATSPYRPSQNWLKSEFDHLTNYQAHELYVKILLNPFYTKGTVIHDRAFEERVLSLAERHLVR
jgi:hypothetical protein